MKFRSTRPHMAAHFLRCDAMKTCFKCLLTKSLEEFYKHSAMGDGRLNKCIACTKADVARHRQQNLESIRAYDRMRGAMPHRLAARREYLSTPEGKAAHRRALKASQLRFPEKRKARIALGNAVRDGRVIPWPACAIPECDCKPEAHHADYARPLDVVWLCERHHKDTHKLARAMAREAKAPDLTRKAI